MTIGDMNKRITLESENRTLGAGGRPVVSYPNIATVWAAVTMRHHSPVMVGDKLDYPNEAIFTTYYDVSYKAARRINWDGTFYSILSVTDCNARSEKLEFRCQERAEGI